MLGTAFLNEGKYDEAMEIWVNIRKSKRVLGNFLNQQNLDAELKRKLLNLSCHYYNIATKMERTTDKIPESEDAKKKIEFAAARRIYHKAITCAPKDEATKNAWGRINAKCNPNLRVIEQPNGDCMVINNSEQTQGINIQY